MSGLTGVLLIPLTYVLLVLLLLFVPMEESGLIEIGHPKE